MKILLAYDGSESAQRALAHAAELAKSDGREVTVVSVAETLHLGRGGTVVPEGEDSERKHELREAEEILARLGIHARLVERFGDPAATIIDEAAEEHSDLIVIGTRGIRAPKRWLLGSVSTKVLHHAPCDVLVVR